MKKYYIKKKHPYTPRHNPMQRFTNFLTTYHLALIILTHFRNFKPSLWTKNIIRPLPHGRQPACPCRLWLYVGLMVTSRQVPGFGTTRAAEQARVRRYPEAVAGWELGRVRREQRPRSLCGTATGSYQAVSPGRNTVPLDTASEDCRAPACHWCGLRFYGSANQGR